MLLDCATTPAVVRSTGSLCRWLSLNFLSERGRLLSMWCSVVGVVLPSARAAPIDMTLAVEPGSKTFWKGRL